MFETLYLLLEKENVTAAELARRFGVSTRTIYRDIDLLSCAGIPVYSAKGAGGGIRLMEGFVLNKAMLTEEEKRQTLSSLSALEAVGAGGQSAALAKLSAIFGCGGADWVEIDFDDWSPDSGMGQRIELFKTAILEHRVAEFDYTGANGTKARRRVEPVRLVFRSSSWYLLAWCRLRRDFRFFKLLRISSPRVFDERFTPKPPPPKITPQPSLGNMVKLTANISADMEYRVRDEFLPQRCRQNADGSFEVNFSMPEDEWLYQYLMSYGEGLKVISPEHVAKKLAQKLEKALAQYR